MHPLHVRHIVPHPPRWDALLVHLVQLSRVPFRWLGYVEVDDHAANDAGTQEQPRRFVAPVRAVDIDCDRQMDVSASSCLLGSRYVVGGGTTHA